MFAVTVTRLEQVQKIYVKGCQCNASEKYVFKNFSCFPKSFNRTFSTMNVIATFKQPIKEIVVRSKFCSNYLNLIRRTYKLEGSLLYKYGTIYRQVISVPPTDFCKLIKDSTTNKVLAQVTALMRDTIGPTAMHECPYLVCYWKIKVLAI